MDRFALFVDAGHLLAEGGSLCCGTKSRSALDCDYPALVIALSGFCANHCCLPLLRVYWYDGARDGVPSRDHLLIGALPFTKLRLGRLSGGKQKGVDSLIVRDLMTLARERAIATAFLLAGDEDLREGMVAAQEMGVAVNVLGIPTTSASGANQAATLIREADQHILLPAGFLEPHITSRGFGLRPSHTQPRTQPKLTVSKDGARDSSLAVQAATAFAATWVAENRSQLPELLAGAPVIPKAIDALLLAGAEAALGQDLRRREDLRKDARAAFWSTVKAAGIGSEVEAIDSGAVGN